MFVGARYLFRGERFCFYHMFKAVVLSTTKFGGHKKALGKLAPNVTSNLPLVAFVFVQGLFVQVAGHCLCRG